MPKREPPMPATQQGDTDIRTKQVTYHTSKRAWSRATATTKQMWAATVTAELAGCDGSKRTSKTRPGARDRRRDAKHGPSEVSQEASGAADSSPREVIVSPVGLIRG